MEGLHGAQDTASQNNDYNDFLEVRAIRRNDLFPIFFASYGKFMSKKVEKNKYSQFRIYGPRLSRQKLTKLAKRPYVYIRYILLINH